MFCIINILLMFLTSFVTYDVKGEIAKSIEDSVYYTPQQTLSTQYKKTNEVLNLSLSYTSDIISTVNKYVGEDNYIYCNEVASNMMIFYFKNSEIPLGEGIIGTQTLLNYYGKESLDEPFTASIIVSGQNLDIKITSTFEGAGIKCDYETSKMVSGNYIQVEGGIWFNKKMDNSEEPVKSYYGSSVRYFPISYYYELFPNIEKYNDFKADDAIISSDLVEYLDLNNENYDSLKYFLGPNDFTNEKIFESRIDMSSIFENGMNIYSYLTEIIDGLPSNQVFVSDEKFDEIKNSIKLFNKIAILGEGNEKGIANIIVNGDFVVDYISDEDVNNEEVINQLIMLKKAINDSKVVIIIIICSLLVFNILLFSILVNFVIHSDFIKIGLLQCFGVSKNKSQIPTLLTPILIFIVSSGISIILSFLLMNLYNPQFNIMYGDFSFNIFSINVFVGILLIGLFIINSLVSIGITKFRLHNKNIKEYFEND